jgi:hypothetical protein
MNVWFFTLFVCLVVYRLLSIITVIGGFVSQSIGGFDRLYNGGFDRLHGGGFDKLHDGGFDKLSHRVSPGNIPH